jgi:hypothetical protein
MNNIDIYYESIKQVFEQIQRWKPPKQPFWERIVDVFMVVTIILFIITLIPILPGGFFIIGGILDLSVFSIILKDATIINFALFWVASTFLFLVLMLIMIWINEKIDSLSITESTPPQSLSPEQLTFIAVYESYKELKIFFICHLEQHIEKSLDALKLVLSNESESDISNPTNYEKRFVYEKEMRFHNHLDQRADFETQVDVASEFLNTFEQYAWFQLDSKTKSTLQAIISFTEKIPSRLKEKQDLPRVLSILENLSKYSYAYLPEHKTYLESSDLEKLHSEGEKSLIKFVQEVNDLTSFSRPEKKTDSKFEIAPSTIDKIKKRFSENIFFRFFVWFIFIVTIASIALVIINQRISLSPDTMVTVIIGTSLASAAALASFLPKKSK